MVSFLGRAFCGDFFFSRVELFNLKKLEIYWVFGY